MMQLPVEEQVDGNDPVLPTWLKFSQIRAVWIAL